jgi:hypothetical protein
LRNFEVLGVFLVKSSNFNKHFPGRIAAKLEVSFRFFVLFLFPFSVLVVSNTWSHGMKVERWRKRGLHEVQLASDGTNVLVDERHHEGARWAIVDDVSVIAVSQTHFADFHSEEGTEDAVFVVFDCVRLRHELVLSDLSAVRAALWERTVEWFRMSVNGAELTSIRSVVLFRSLTTPWCFGSTFSFGVFGGCFLIAHLLLKSSDKLRIGVDERWGEMLNEFWKFL